MLNEEEYGEMEAIYARCLNRLMEALQFQNVSISELGEEREAECFRDVTEWYFQQTGDTEDHSAVRHHRIALYGPACNHCGKPLRTPQASFCAECGGNRRA